MLSLLALREASREAHLLLADTAGTAAGLAAGAAAILDDKGEAVPCTVFDAALVASAAAAGWAPTSGFVIAADVDVAVHGENFSMRQAGGLIDTLKSICVVFVKVSHPIIPPSSRYLHLDDRKCFKSWPTSLSLHAISYLRRGIVIETDQ